MPLFTTPLSLMLSIHYPSNSHFICTAWALRPAPDEAVDKHSTQGCTINLQWKHTHIQTQNFCIETYHPPRPFCSRCRCHYLWAGSKCRNLGLECCCYLRDYTALEWKKKEKDYVRLQQSGEQLQREEIFQQLMGACYQQMYKDCEQDCDCTVCLKFRI